MWRAATLLKGRRHWFYLRQKLEGPPACVLHHAKPDNYSVRGFCLGFLPKPRSQRTWEDLAPFFRTAAMPYTATATTSAPAARHSFFAALLCAVMSLCLLSAAPDAHAARKKTAQTNDSTTQKKSSVKSKRHRSPSEETTAERDRRMYRECWGRPNAGACLGYTRR